MPQPAKRNDNAEVENTAAIPHRCDNNTFKRSGLSATRMTGIILLKQWCMPTQPLSKDFFPFFFLQETPVSCYAHAVSFVAGIVLALLGAHL